MIPFPFQFGGFGSSLPVATGGGGGDPDFANVKLLMHFEGANNSTTFTDVIGNTMTRSGDAKIVTAQFDVGTSSGYFDGLGDNVFAPETVNHRLGTVSNWTIECSVRVDSTGSGTRAFFGRAGNVEQQSYWCYVNGSNVLVFIYTTAGTNATAQTLSSPSALSHSTWYKIAIVRDGATLYMFIDGVMVASRAMTNFYDGVFKGLRIGESAIASFPYTFKGWVDEFRLTNGISRYTADYTVSTSAFPDS